LEVENSLGKELRIKRISRGSFSTHGWNLSSKGRIRSKMDILFAKLSVASGTR
jgi:hypothetical protein